MPRRQQKLLFSELRVGLFMLAALVVTGFLILNSSGSFNPFEKRMRLKARFVSADGLHTGADVQLAGVSVGKVEDVRFLPPDSPGGERIEATLSVSEEFENKPITDLIRTDSTAKMVATSVLGNDKMINITPGTSKGTPVQDNAVLLSSATVGLSELTSTGNDLLGQINKLAIPANEILNKANQGEGTLGRVINDEQLYKDLDDAVSEVRNVMTKVNTGNGSAGRLINDPALYNNLNKTVGEIETMVADIKAGRGSAGKLLTDEALYNETRSAVADLRTSAAKISEIADDVKAITVDLRAGRGTAGKLLTDDKFYEDARVAIDRFNAMTARVDRILADAQAGKGTLGKILTDETLYNNLSVTANNVATFTGEGTKLLDDFRKNPKKYLTIKLTIF
jgi:phospholipid/cholesterol/gamma-HCH transport system substrate-binding protein